VKKQASHMISTLLFAASTSAHARGVAPVDPREHVPAPTITSPANGSSLTTNVGTFEWSAGADEYWLLVGRSPGRSDVYSGHFSGATTQQRVARLPLDGRTFYVELRSRIKDRILTSTNRYNAAVRKGLCVVVDFQNSKLEDWKEPPGWPLPPGVHSMGEVRGILDQMEEHWGWLSRGIEKVEWDLARVTLPRDLKSDSSYGYRTFRAEVMDAAIRQGIDPAEYDVDADGIVDSVWMLASSGKYEGGNYGEGGDYTWLTGGAALVAGARSFVDAQANYAVSYRRYGAFNHEFGHNVGLPDLYGTYSTVEELTLMGNTVEQLPGADFSAFERETLGWLKPRVVDRTTRGIVLPPASEALAAVKVPTDRPFEYFLVEYRKTPEDGYGSLGPRYDGLAVFHVFEPSVQALNPPLLRIEAADGDIGPDTGPAPELTDLYYPGNPVMDLSRVMRSYLTNRPVFRVQNVRWAKAGIRFDIQTLHDGGSRAVNLARNGGFEQGEDGPGDWTTSENDATFEWTSEVSHRGARSVSISASDPVHREWKQSIEGLAPGRAYLLCGWLKGREVVGVEDKDVGANVLISGTFDRRNAGFGTFDWTRTCMAFEAPGDGTANIACGLGGWGSQAFGTVWCDDFRVSLPHPAF
jgi:M6 family metalloprotease-like protein